MTCKKRDILAGIFFKTPLLHHSLWTKLHSIMHISQCSFHVLCFLSLITGNTMTPGNQTIHDPETAEINSAQSLQDMIVRLSAMRVKMVGFT